MVMAYGTNNRLMTWGQQQMPYGMPTWSPQPLPMPAPSPYGQDGWQGQYPAPQPVYQPQYQQPAYQPQYQQPAYQPQYQQPAYQPQYQQPAYQPQYQQPAYQPQYQQPAYAPQYQQPAYTPQGYAPSYPSYTPSYAPPVPYPPPAPPAYPPPAPPSLPYQQVPAYPAAPYPPQRPAAPQQRPTPQRPQGPNGPMTGSQVKEGNRLPNSSGRATTFWDGRHTYKGKRDAGNASQGAWGDALPPTAYFCALPVGLKGGGNWWHNQKILITNPSNGKQVVVKVQDKGPAPWTHNVVDLSPVAKEALGVNFMDNMNVQIAFAPDNAAVGPVN